MACLKIPIPEGPQLPAPFGIPKIAPQFPDLPDTVCCKLPPHALPPLPTFIPATSLDPSIIASINAGIKAVRDYVDLQPLKCPKE